jgi:DNA-binding transcriptional ArsR family regulator
MLTGEPLSGRLRVTKQRDQDFISDIHFQLRKVSVGFTADHEEIGSAVVDFQIGKVMKLPTVEELAPALRSALEGLQEALQNSGLDEVSTIEWETAHRKIVGTSLTKDAARAARKRLRDKGLVEEPRKGRWQISPWFEDGGVSQQGNGQATPNQPVSEGGAPSALDGQPS